MITLSSHYVSTPSVLIQILNMSVYVPSTSSEEEFHVGLENLSEGDIEYLKILGLIDQVIGESVNHNIKKEELQIEDDFVVAQSPPPPPPRCIICRLEKKKARKQKNPRKTKWPTCLATHKSGPCMKLLCKPCYKRSVTIKRKTPCILCGYSRKYIWICTVCEVRILDLQTVLWNRGMSVYHPISNITARVFILGSRRVNKISYL